MNKIHILAHLASIVHDAEMCSRAEFWNSEFAVLAVFLDHFFNQRLVCCFGKPTFLINQSKDTHGLRRKGVQEPGIKKMQYQLTYICYCTDKHNLLTLTFSKRSMHGCKSRPKSMNFHSIPSFLYSSCTKEKYC